MPHSDVDVSGYFNSLSLGEGVDRCFNTASDATNAIFIVEDTKTHITFINKTINKFKKDSIFSETYTDAKKELEILKQKRDPLSVCVILDMNFP